MSDQEDRTAEVEEVTQETLDKDLEKTAAEIAGLLSLGDQGKLLLKEMKVLRKLVAANNFAHNLKDLLGEEFEVAEGDDPIEVFAEWLRKEKKFNERFAKSMGAISALQSELQRKLHPRARPRPIDSVWIDEVMERPATAFGDEPHAERETSMKVEILGRTLYLSIFSFGRREDVDPAKWDMRREAFISTDAQLTVDAIQLMMKSEGTHNFRHYDQDEYVSGDGRTIPYKLPNTDE